MISEESIHFAPSDFRKLDAAEFVRKYDPA
jgi:hypothetical protein